MNHPYIDMPSCILGKRSLQELQGVHPDLVAVVKRAIEPTPQDFTVHDGLRTIEQQRELVGKGASTTLKARHLTGHAVDLVPIINGKVRWEWPPIYRIAEAVRAASLELAIPIRWGGAWDVEFTSSTDSAEDLVHDYTARRRSQGKRAFIDGPHYELPKDRYP